MTHDFSDPKAPSTRESVIMKPDAGAAGGLKVVRPAEVARRPSRFTIGG